MIIPEYLRKFYEPNPNDDEKTRNFKKYIFNREKIDKEIAERQQENSDKSKDIYNELKKMKGKTPIEQLEREYFINELLNNSLIIAAFSFATGKAAIFYCKGVLI